MPCSAVGCRREGSAMPVPVARSVLDSTEIPRLKYSSGMYVRKSSYSNSSYSDIQRYSSSRSLTGSRLTSDDTPTNRDRSVTRDSSISRASLLARDSTSSSSRSRSSTYSTDSSSLKSTRKNVPYTSADLNDFRSFYSPQNYTVGSARLSTKAPLILSTSTGDTSTSLTIRSKPLHSTSSSLSSGLSSTTSTLATSLTSSPTSSVKELTVKRASDNTETSSSPSNSLEVITDENHNVMVEEGESVSRLSLAEVKKDLDEDETAVQTSTVVKVSEVKPTTNNSVTPAASVDDDVVVEASTSNESSSDSDSYTSRYKTSGLSLKREVTPPNDNNGLSGLRNIGNTCFLNSVVQCLSNTRELKDMLVNKEYLPDITNSETKGALIKSFADVVCELWSGEGKIVNTSAFKSQIQRYAPRFMGYNQQDAQEFLRYLLQGIHDDINRVKVKPRNLPPIDDNLNDSAKASESWKQYLRCDNSRIVDLFVGQLKSTLRCTVCNHCSTTFEVFWDLSLPLPSRVGSLRLSQCLDVFTKEEVLDGDEMPTCSKCKARRKCTKSFSIQKFPRILVLHLKRFSPSERYRKLSATVEFPLTNLDMSPYSSTPQSCSYNLYAVSNHSGTAYSGHYTAYCMHPHSLQWHEYNDSRVSSISHRNVVSSEAYILFYEQTSGVAASRL